MIETEEIEKAIISLNCGFDVVLYGEANAYFLALDIKSKFITNGFRKNDEKVIINQQDDKTTISIKKI